MNVKRLINSPLAPWIIAFIVCILAFWQPMSYFKHQANKAKDSLLVVIHRKDSLARELAEAKTKLAKSQLTAANIEKTYYEQLYSRQLKMEQMLNSIALVPMKKQKTEVLALLPKTSLPATGKPQVFTVVQTKVDTVCYDSLRNAQINIALKEAALHKDIDTTLIKENARLKVALEEERQSNQEFYEEVTTLSLCDKWFCRLKKKLRAIVRGELKRRSPTGN